MELFANRYRIIELLGKGGMGNVYLVEDTLLANDRLALKVLKSEYSQNPSYKERFIAEVKIARQISHNNVIRTFDFGSDAEENLYFTMEYLRGLNMQERLKVGIPEEEVVEIILCICDGLKAIHDKGIIHRDLKPANIIQTTQGEIKITDFGVSSLDRKKNVTDEILGSAPYMAPECWGTGTITVASDLYSLGVLAYELLTGVLPFDGKSSEEFMYKHLEKKPTPPNEINLELPGYINEIVMKLLSKLPQNRPQITEIIKCFEGYKNNPIVSVGYEEEPKTLEFSHPMMKTTPIGTTQEAIPSPIVQIVKEPKSHPILSTIISFIIISGLLALTSFFNFRNDKYSSDYIQLGIPLLCMILITITPSLVANKLLLSVAGLKKFSSLFIIFICILINAYQRDLISQKILAPDNHLNGLFTDSVLSLWHTVLLVPGGATLSLKSFVIGFASLIFGFSFVNHKRISNSWLILIVIIALMLLERCLWYILTNNSPFIITASNVHNIIYISVIGFINLLILNILRAKV